MHLWAWQGDSSVCSCISTRPMYFEYKAHVLGVQEPCTESTEAMYFRKKAKTFVSILFFTLFSLTLQRNNSKESIYETSYLLFLHMTY